MFRLFFGNRSAAPATTTPSGRNVNVTAETRNVEMVAEDRNLSAAAEDRNVTVRSAVTSP